ncbi:MAG: OmpH family outer membrane protein [Saprospiraceae bacterium]|jgi:outer membrane protein
MKPLLKITTIVAVLSFVSTALIGQEVKFGFLNSALILAEMPEVKQADANLEALEKQLQKRGQGMVEKLQQDYAAAQAKMERGELSRIQQEEEAKKLEDRQMEIARYEQEMIQQVQEKRNELLEPIYAKVNEAISSVAKENGYKMIFDASVLLYKDDAMDVSNLVKAKLGLQN